MGSKGGGSTTSTTTSVMQPDPLQVAYLQQTMPYSVDALQQAQRDIAWNPQLAYQGQQIAPLGANAQVALDQMWKAGLTPSTSQQAMQYGLESTLGNQYGFGSNYFGNLAGATMDPLNRASGMLTGFSTPQQAQQFAAMNAAAEQARLGQGYTAAGMNALNQFAGERGVASPGFQAAMQAATNRILPQIQSQAAASGRVGSGAQQGLIASNVADAFAGLYGQEQAMKLQALGQAGQMGSALENQQAQYLRDAASVAQNMEAQRLASLGQAAGYQGQQAGILAGLAGDERSRQMQAAGMVPALQGIEQQRLGNLTSVSDYLQNLYQQQINADMARWQFEQQEPWNRALQYASVTQGIPLQFGGGTTTGTQTGQLPTSSRLGGAFGGAASGAALGSFIPGVGTAIGAGIGGLLGLFA